MYKSHKLIAIVKTKNINELIKTKFFYTNKKVFYDVTTEICEAIYKYNKDAQKIIDRGKYSLIIPIRYNHEHAEYGYGFGATHYFQRSEFDRINKYIKSFPLNKCKFEVFLPNDIKTILNSNPDDEELGVKIHSHLY